MAAPCKLLALAFAALAISAGLGCLGDYDALPEPLCGNGVVDVGEQCDDANEETKDGCEVDCRYSGALVWSTDYDEDMGAPEIQEDVAIDSTGHIYVTGLANNRTDYKWLQRYTPEGQLLWTFTLPIDSEDSAIYGLTVDSADRAVVSGRRSNSGYLTSFVMSVNSDAKLVWALQPETAEPLGSYATDVVAALGKLHLLSTTYLFAGDTYVGTSLSVLTLGDDGEVVSRFSYAPEPDDDYAGSTVSVYSNGLAVAADGTVLVAAVYDYGSESARDRGVIAAFDPSGALRWEDRRASPYGEVRFVAVRVDNEGQVVAQGVTTTTELPSQVGDNFDRFLRKYDSSGQLLWATDYDDGDHGDDYVGTIAIDSGNNIVIVGRSALKAWLRKVGPGGETFWTRNLAPDELRYSGAWGVAVDADDSIVAAGFYNYSATEGNNGWVAKYTP